MEKYWRSLEELKQGSDNKAEKAAEKEHKDLVLDLAKDEKITSATASRRDFLKLVGFSFATAAITSSCEKPVQKAIPYLIKPEEITPGKANYYATSFFDGTEYCSVVAKVRDGRPIKLEANKLSLVSGGGTSARVQASVLSLYDQARLKNPAKGRNKVTWEEIDKAVTRALGTPSEGRKVLLTSTVISPTTRKLIASMKETYADLDWVVYDEISASAIRSAYQKIYGPAIIPSHHFEKAKVILSFDADFLGTWLTPIEFAAGYAKGREVSRERPEMSKHYQLESGYSLTGSNADERFPVTPDKLKAIVAKLYNELAAGSGLPLVDAPGCEFDTAKIIKDLQANSGESIVVSGSNDPEIQYMVAAINQMLDNVGNTIDPGKPLNVYSGDDATFTTLAEDLIGGKVSMLLMHNVNPVYSSGMKLEEAIKKVPLSVFSGHHFSETAKVSTYVAPDHHYLEAWGDAEPVYGSFSLQQPTIHPLYETRAFQDSMLTWMGSETNYYDYLREWWANELFPLSGALVFENWWNEHLQKGVFDTKKRLSLPGGDFSMASCTSKELSSGLALQLYLPVGVTDGRHANNPWLQELPDPITKVCWDNYLAVSVQDAADLGLQDEDVVDVGGIKVPVLVQPGQAKGTCSLALGYGRTTAGKVGDNVGVNGFAMVGYAEKFRQYAVKGITLSKTGETYTLARTQTHHSMEERPIVRETSLEEYAKDPASGNEYHAFAESHETTMFPEAKFDGYHWGLAIDLNKCVGCNNCVVSCIAENNIATVGKEEVKNRRIMHWMRIDRYYSEDVENPKTYHQPVMCQHCDNAPCENVCPVAATMHSNEGLNQVAYVRCIGTKYCINNCPYRVRRFNWFKYVDNDKFNFHLNDQTSKLVLNPDVTVRSRGVVEKCSLCVQRIQEKKLEAKLEGRALEDGEVQPACVQSCPAGALVFGDLNNKESQVSKSKANERNYHLLEQLHTLPSVGYLTKVRNTEPSGKPKKAYPMGDHGDHHDGDHHDSEHHDTENHG